MEVEGELPDMNAEEMTKEGFYLVKSVLRHRYRQGWQFLTLWEGFGVKEATWEHFSALVKPVRTPVAIFGSLGVCIYVPASRHWLISYSPIHLT